MVGRLITGILIFFSVMYAAGQSVNQKNLFRLDSTYKAQRAEAELRIQKFLKDQSNGRVFSDINGAVIGLIDVSPSGVPIYIKADNAGVATSLGVNELRTGGSLGLNLEGSGIQVGIWDEGKVRNDHVEYVGRITQLDNASTFSEHASHVLGTIMATGVNANAKGMAPKATAIAYDFFNDVSEMIGKATPDQTSIILSNHSYGTLSGWNFNGSWTWHGDPSISNVQDWKFGFYNSTANLYDDIVFNAPYYLIVKSAGNDNNDTGDGTRPRDCNPFDCIPTNGVAKNILTVGAVKKLIAPYTGPADVEIASFSSLGPTDDGRIKPDIVAPGQAVFSASSNSSSAYETLSGTSMSAPATTGTLVLLQELHKNLNAGNLMKASTLKALAIHTAREAGPSPGPDFKFGWGLLDAEGAAKTLINKDDQNIFIKELTLNNNGVFEMELTPKENTKITATLVWTDPAGTVLSPALNPTTKMLKNDLDLRLVDDGGTIQFPWRLNGGDPSVAATKGDNIVDNVEKLEFDNPEPRNYKLKVSHKGALVGSKQDFSLVLTYTSVIDPRISYYWIGNSGDWNVGSNWSLSSGGTAANVVPTTEDKVVFDENSFSANNQTVSLTQDQQCYSIRWFANELIHLSFNSHQLTVQDGVNLLSNNIASSSPGEIFFTGTNATLATIDLGNNDLKHFILKFSGQNSNWSMVGNFKIGGIELIEGNISLTDNTISMNSLSATGVLSKQLTLNNSIITGIAGLNLDFSNLNLEGEENAINVPTASTYTLNLGSNFFNGIINLSGGEMVVSGNGSVEGVKGTGNLIISGNNSWNNIELNGGSLIEMEQLSTQTVAESFALTATGTNRITVISSGAGLATLEFSDHQKICLDNLDVTNVNVSGEAVVNAGVNSTLTNSPNWFKDSCSNILFPDFNVSFNCEEAAVFFIDHSSGPITSRDWNFGELNSGSNESNSVNPIHKFEEVGQYTITLKISNGNNSESFSKMINLKPTVLTQNKIDLVNGKLISFLPADKYQWVLDGELLENTNKRSIDFSNKLGFYSVLTFNDTCNRQSETFLVTNIKTSDEGKSLLIYPNPAHQVIFIKASGVDVRNIRLMNNLGQSKSVNSTEVEDGWKIDISDVPAGVYLLQIQTDGGISYHRVAVDN